MQFIDQAFITVRAGRGGDGIVSFRREKFVPAGGPSGGDGGKGGSIIFQADSNLQTLLDFKFQKFVIGDNGKRGGPNKCSGSAGKDLILKVPCGTEVSERSTGVVFGDLTQDGDLLTVANGGKGGLGNAHYLSNRNRAPEKFTEGSDGDERELNLELKLIAEVGIIGLPNAGKSTLISVLSSAKPKVADYPFTTLVPNLGVVRRPSGHGTVFADIPGLIKGAASGIGLGHEFLRHIERTRLLIHLVDISSNDPISDVKVVEAELQNYRNNLLAKRRVLVFNKKELVSKDYQEKLLQLLDKNIYKDVFLVSASLREGLKELLDSIWGKLDI